MFILSALNSLQSRSGKQILFTEVNIVLNPVAMLWCLGFRILVVLDLSGVDIRVCLVIRLSHNMLRFSRLLKELASGYVKVWPLGLSDM
jgi:hypothetical protein